jgi:hypothetical protein
MASSKAQAGPQPPTPAASPSPAPTEVFSALAAPSITFERTVIVAPLADDTSVRPALAATDMRNDLPPRKRLMERYLEEHAAASIPSRPAVRPGVQTTTTTKIRFRMDTMDIIAIVSAGIAVLFAVGMYTGRLPIDATNISIITCSAILPALVKMGWGPRDKED